MASDRNRPIFHRLQLNKTNWDIPIKYSKLQLIGSGAYGQVCSAYNGELKHKVAIKKMSRPFQSDIHAKRTYREIRMLKHMKHDDIIGLLDIFTTASSLHEFEDLYMVTELMGPDLGKVLKNQVLSAAQIQLYVYQILRGLKYIHSAGIIHRDLKPSNIAVDINNELKILDFGLARYQGYKTEEMTGYVITRWYRAPEIMLNWMHYNNTVDVWSVGCIMAELFSGRTLFPGSDSIDQLKKTMIVLGTPSDTLLKKLTSDDARSFIQSMPRMPKQNFRKDPRFREASNEAIDLMEKMLDMDPDTRITAEMALAHPYLEKYGDPTDEPVSEPYDPSFENDTLSTEEWKKLVYQEVQSFQPRPAEKSTF